jgi:hypothetical protein
MSVRSQPRQLVWVTLVIVAVLGLQVAAVAGSVSSLFWPFTDYPMYREAHHEGETLHDYLVVARLDDGTERRVGRKDFNLNVWQFQKEVLQPMTRRQVADEDRARLRRAVELFEAKHARRIVALRLEDRPHVLSRRGVQAAPERIVGRFDRDFWSLDR